jgi:phosphoribosylformimino-5-aminoimidazole carboxamide ribotide isomerase
MIYPSIDLMNGKAVQLVQGNKEKKKIEIEDVFFLAERFSQLGEINVIDLDAALELGSNKELIFKLAARFPIRVGGGIRSPEMAKAYIDSGAKKIIVGSSAFFRDSINFSFLDQLNQSINKKQIMIALDSYKEAIVKSGWTETTMLNAGTIIKSLQDYCEEFLYTQVDKEGLMQGTDLQRLIDIKALTKNALAAAGGICSIEEIQALRSHGISSVLGMALYTGKLSFDDLLQLR